MSIKHYKKDLNNGSDLLSINNTNKSFVNEKEFKSFYRMKNGEKIKYIEKSDLDIIEEMLHSEENENVLDFNIFISTIRKYIEENSEKTFEYQERYTKLSSIALKLNMSEIYSLTSYCIAANKEILFLNLNINQIFSDEKTNTLNEIEEIQIKDIEKKSGLLKELMDELKQCILEEISSIHNYNEILKTVKDLEINEAIVHCEQICEIKQNIINKLNEALNKLFKVIEEKKMKIALIQTSEKFKQNLSEVVKNQEKGEHEDV